MKKAKEMSDPLSCLNKAEDGEPIFILRAKDPCAALAIMHWVTLRIEEGLDIPGDDNVLDACKLVLEIHEWRRQHE